ncbi:MAG: FkbM family methyltransferase [Ruminococcaceae bacterium]|nr:FkbM family methyltransferase [Oscillospiraceae bacterium]
MIEKLFDLPDIWERLNAEKRPILLWGTGNGADKILDVCEARSILISGIFASDGFVRNRDFRGFPVTSWADAKKRFCKEKPVVLMAFGSSRPEVLENAKRIASEATLLAPDVPSFGEGLFTRAFANEHRDEIFVARELLSDEESKRIFDLVLTYKWTGDIAYLLKAVSDPDEISKNILRPETIRTYADLGAYTGDTIQKLAQVAPNLTKVFALEPDPRNYRKLAAFAETETRFSIDPIEAAAWNAETELLFDGSGNRNSGALSNRSAALETRPAKIRPVRALPLDDFVASSPVDFIKYDVEGSEREALEGSCKTILHSFPKLMVSVYHRVDDFFALPLFVKEFFPAYNRFYLRRDAGIPAWDLNFWAVKE